MLEARLIEDRGRLGVGGRRLFVVEIPMEPAEPMIVEMPEEDIDADETEHVAPTKQQITEYLKHGGLLSILRAGASAGPNQPRVWLRVDSYGNVVHTFIKELGQVGGAVVPSMSLHDGKIFKPQVDEVRGFVRTFGLSAADAAELVRSIKTAP